NIVFGPFAVSARGALLAPVAISTPDAYLSKSINQGTSLVPGQYEHFGALAAELGSELQTRVDAAARYIGYESQFIDFKGGLPVEDLGWVEIARRVNQAADVLRRPL
ncbi:MAG: hypothetical protein ACJAZN_003698, partial [Planctomycetota bacterium]